MIHRMYGSTGIKVSALGFGGMRFADTSDVDACARLVKKCHDAGITYFDTAIGYGKSEDVMGVAFREMAKTRRERPFYVATKTFKSTPDDVRRELEKSLSRLQIDAVDFYHVWCVMSPDIYRERKRQGVLKAFEKMKEEGLIRHICISSHMAGDEIGGVLRDYPFDGVLLGYSAMNFAYRESALASAHALGRGIVTMNPLGGGVIPRHPDRFGFVKSRPDETVVEGALRFLFNDPRISVVLAGISNEAQLGEALKAVEGFTPLAPEAVARIRESQKQAFDALCTGCAYCDDCPKGLPVPRLMEAYNHFVLSGTPKTMTDRLANHWGVPRGGSCANECIECGICERACTQKLPIVRRLKEIAAEVAKSIEEDGASKKP